MPMSDLSMPEELAAAVGTAPTVRFYAQLQRAFDHFNQMLFDGRLTPCLITLRSSNRHNGYHHAKRFMNTKGEWLDELGMHPGFMALRSVEEVLSTLVHEMVSPLAAARRHPIQVQPAQPRVGAEDA
jgi:hypothetical protein